MKSKNSKKKLSRYSLGTMKQPGHLGYQMNQGAGIAGYSTQKGEDISGDVRAMKSTRMANTVNKIVDAAKYPMEALQNMTAVPMSVASNVTNLPVSTINATSTLAQQAAQTTGGKLLSGLGMRQVGEQAATTATNVGTKQALSSIGKVAAGVGTAIGVHNVLSDLFGENDGVRSAGEMANTRDISTITTPGGNQYKAYGTVNAAAERAYQDQVMSSKRMNLATDLMQVGGSAGLFAGIPGLIVGGIGGLGLGILGSFLGYGDNSDETNRLIARVNDNSAMQTRQNLSGALTEDTKAAFYNRGGNGIVNAANGKLPGFHNGKANARVSNGEIVGNFKDGWIRVPGTPNNKDSVKTHLNKQDYVISNKGGLSEYVAKTGDVMGALAAQTYLQNTGMMNKFKNGKLPKYSLGTTLLSLSPHIARLTSNLSGLKQGENGDIYAPDVYVDNPEGTKAVNTLAQLRFDADPYYRQAQRGLNWANYDVRRNVGLGQGGRAIAQATNYTNYLSGLSEITKMVNEAQTRNAEKYAAALASLGNTNQGRRMEAAAKRHEWMQQAAGARANWMAQYRKNIDTNLLDIASEYMRQGQYRDALKMDERRLGIYESDAETKRMSAEAAINNLGNNNSTVAAVKTPSDKIKEWWNSLTPAQQQYYYGEWARRSAVNET